MKAAALIMAGGSGERFASAPGTPKQLVELCGRPMISWSTDALAQASGVGALLIVLPHGLESQVREALSAHAQSKLLGFALGGATREESVFNGLRALPDGYQHVLIHDAARPCASPKLIESVLDALQTHDAVVPAVAVTDTLVRDYDGKVDAIIDRVHVAGVQTPQAFKFDLILRAHREARARGFQSSDDGSLVLALGEAVHTVPGERTNIKVTVREDVAMAEAVLTMRKNGVRT
jgi:2-C-methyl-D-erythritol 4-phosphate cytidylyltransferase